MGKKRKRESLSEVEDASSSAEENNTGDYFFDVKKNLKELFNSAEGDEFSFFGNSLPEGKTQPVKPNKTGNKEALVESEVLQKITYKFFFHATRESLRNRLDENDFVRTKSQDELNQEWPERRTVMKSSFRKRYKETQKMKKRKHTVQVLHNPQPESTN